MKRAIHIILVLLIAGLNTGMFATEKKLKEGERQLVSMIGNPENRAEASVNSQHKDSISVKSVPGSVGLVLSGGGAKGIAHVGVIKALEDHGVPIDYVTGTSMGAIVGSLYACGWSPEEMLEFFTSEDFKYWSSGQINPENVSYISKPEPTPQWVQLNINFKDSVNVPYQIIPTSLINPLPMNIEFLNLYTKYSEQCGRDFDNLMVPYRCVASDVYHKHKVVLSKGSLGDAVRASMTFPLVFRPIEIDGNLLFDGGIYDNFPVNVMTETFNPEFMIGVSVSGPDGKPEQGDVYSQLEDMIIQNNDYSLPADKGVKIQVPVLQFGVLDFSLARTIYDIGYKTGEEMVDSILSRCPSRRSPEEVAMRRKKFAEATPKIYYDSVAVNGTGKKTASFLKYVFDNGGKRIDMEDVCESYYRAVTSGKISNLVPQTLPGADGRNTLLLDVQLKKPWSFGAGGWITTTSNNLLYLNAGYRTLNYNALDFDVSGYLGQTYLAGMFNVKFSILGSLPSYLRLEGVLSRQKYHQDEIYFYQSNSSPSFVTENENYLRLNYCYQMGKKGLGFSSIGWGYIKDSFYPVDTKDFMAQHKNSAIFKVAALRTGYRRNTMNHFMYPSEGMQFEADLLATYENMNYTFNNTPEATKTSDKRFKGSVEILWKHYVGVSKHVTLGFMANGLATLQNENFDYTSMLLRAPEFAPTPSTRYIFNKDFRNDNYLAAGLMPIWRPLGNLQFRGDFYVYAPVRQLKMRPSGMAQYTGWFKKTEFIGEIAAVYNFPFASLSVYGNYLTSPANNWNFGLNIGILLHAPKFLR